MTILVTILNTIPGQATPVRGSQPAGPPHLLGLQSCADCQSDLVSPDCSCVCISNYWFSVLSIIFP